jgi:ferredoxin-type protein NapH
MEKWPVMKKRIKASTIRALVALATFVVVGIGLAFNTGFGTLSSLGYNAIAAICPLGALEAMLGNRAFVLHTFIALIAVVLIVVAVGKSFCSWLCPVPHLRDFFKSKERKNQEAEERRKAAQYALENYQEDITVPQPKVTLDSRHAVLAGALLSTVIFGFPVFCLVCPVGLTFAVFIGLWRLVQFNDLTWGLLVFPAILLIEMVFMRRWCLKICPMGALFSIIASVNKTLRPVVDSQKCLRSASGTDCSTCVLVCPEHVDPHSDKGLRPMTECTKCRLCADACPAKAVTIPFLAKGSSKHSD